MSLPWKPKKFKFARAGWGILCMVLVTSCVQEYGEVPGVHERVQELRPTSPDHPRGYEEAVEIRSFPSIDGHARVWWATEGVDRPPGADRNESGVPDFVELVAGVADEVQGFLIDEGIFRLPIVDSTLMSDPDDYGLDDRFDIYLKDFGGAGDGHFSVDACVEPEGVRRCTGHMVLENDFSPLYYPSLDYAVRVVVPHEYFHAVQFAYNAEMPAWWAEGTATWFEEYFYPEQDDFERLTRFYFESPERSLTDRPRAPSDAFAYGASIFVYFLEHEVGVGAIVEMMERMALGEGALDAVVEVVEEHAGSFEEAFSLFGVFNVFTGSRAVEGQGYPQAHRFNEVDVVELDGSRAVNWDVQVSPMAARFGRIEVTRPIEVSTGAIEGYGGVRAVAVSGPEFARTGRVDILSDDDVKAFGPEDSPVFLVVTQGQAPGDGATRIALRAVRDEEPGEPDVGEPVDELPAVDIGGDGGGDEAGGCVSASSAAPSPLTNLSLLLVMLLFVKRRFGVRYERS
ncbi:MAG: MXAN_6640 family putative metalloprotease [Bradymonadaceae bacterium]